MNYNVAVIGLNHKTAPLEIREILGFNSYQREEALVKLKELYPQIECIVLSTCNRVEIYVGNVDGKINVDNFVDFLSSSHNVSKDDIIPYIYIYEQEEAVRHLFEVASGLDSLVVGENQIAGQAKKAYQKALKIGATGKILNKAFQKAFAVSKKVRTLTKISQGNVSISSVSCQLAEEVLGDFSEKNILLIGAGKIGALTLKSLHDKGAKAVLVSSRNYEKAKNLAKEFNGKAIEFHEIEEYIKEADIVISSTSAPHYVLRFDLAERVAKMRNDKPIFLIDLAVPRDIDPSAGEIENVHLYNIDSLKRIAQENIKQRENEIFWCKEIISEKAKSFIHCHSRASGNLSYKKPNDKLFEIVAS